LGEDKGRISFEMTFSQRQKKLRLISFILSISIIVLLAVGWRFVKPELGKIYILFWSICIILSLILILVALEEVREITRYYLEKRREVIRKTLGGNGKRKR